MSNSRTFNTFGTLFQCFACGSRTKMGNFDQEHYLCFGCLRDKRQREFKRKMMRDEYAERQARSNSRRKVQ